MGPTAWKTHLAGSRPAVVATALPVGQVANAASSRMMVGPPARWMAPSTPPPPAREELAALAMASTGILVMSPSTRRMVCVGIVTQASWPASTIYDNRKGGAENFYLRVAADPKAGR